MSKYKKSYKIIKNDFIKAGEASINVKNLLKSLNLDSQLIRRISICGYEAEINVAMHGGDGSLTIEIDEEKIIETISDSGEGIEDIEKAMTKGFSTASDEWRERGFGAGMGLWNIKKNSDDMFLKSEVGKGTVLKLIFNISN